jgi:chitinase
VSLISFSELDFFVFVSEMIAINLLFFSLFFVTFVNVYASGGDTSINEPHKTQFSIFGYLPEWRYSGANFDFMYSHLTHLALFSVEPDPKGTGDIIGLDRLPSGEAFEDVRLAAARHSKYLLICFGGNGRSAGFSSLTNPTIRAKFITNVVDLVTRYGAQGVDYNWEYPGFNFESGYTNDLKKLRTDWDTLRDLIIETKKAFGDPRGIVTVAYYPDGKQEKEMKTRQLDKHADLLHAMTYDQSGKQHSPIKLAETAISNAKKANLDLSRITLGLPFYGRDDKSGDWVTYEDIISKSERFYPTDTGNTVFDRQDNRRIGFNSVAMIEDKVKLAISQGLGGVMIWESGQDCRVQSVIRDGTTHERTCPGPPPNSYEDPFEDPSSLHCAISRAAKEALEAKKNGILSIDDENDVESNTIIYEEPDL